MNSSSTEFSQLLTTINCSHGTSHYIASGRTPWKHRLLLSRNVLDVFTDPLPSNRHPIVARVGSRGKVFAEPLPSNGSTGHNTLNRYRETWNTYIRLRNVQHNSYSFRDTQTTGSVGVIIIPPCVHNPLYFICAWSILTQYSEYSAHAHMLICRQRCFIYSYCSCSS
jgi:hypothetical protein